MKKLRLIPFILALMAVFMLSGFAADTEPQALSPALPFQSTTAEGDVLFAETSEMEIYIDEQCAHMATAEGTDTTVRFGCYTEEPLFLGVGIQDDTYLYDYEYHAIITETGYDEFFFTLDTASLPAGEYTLIVGIEDGNQNPVYGYFGIEYKIVKNEIPLNAVSFYKIVDDETIDYITEDQLCPGTDAVYGLIYEPDLFTGYHDIDFGSDFSDFVDVYDGLGLMVAYTGEEGVSNVYAYVDGNPAASMEVTVAHTYSTEVITKPTCTQTGIMTYTCACGDSYEEEIPALGHDYIETVTVAPTCTTVGAATYTCSVCGDSYQAELPIDPDAHDYGENELTIIQEPTACKPGEGVQHCDLCDTDVHIELSAIFSDVEPDNYYSDAVDYFYANGYIRGTTQTKFGPTVALSRAMLVTILYRMEGEPETTAEIPFTDVPADQYYAAPVAWAYENGITTGITPTLFKPDNKITREQLATFIYRFAEYKNVDTSGAADLTEYPDEAVVQDYAKDAIAWCVDAGIMQGTLNNGITTLNPAGNATRAQAVTMLYRYIGFAEEHPAPVEPEEPETPTDPEDPETPTDPEEPGDTDEVLTTVWVSTKGGTKYHSVSDCSGMTDAECISLEEAVARGYEPCKNCVQ